MGVREYAKSRFGLGEAAAYEAAERGDFPVIRIGRRLFVPVAAADQKLGLTAQLIAAE
jgi:hypothetical protein